MNSHSSTNFFNTVLNSRSYHRINKKEMFKNNFKNSFIKKDVQENENFDKSEEMELKKTRIKYIQ